MDQSISFKDNLKKEPSKLIIDNVSFSWPNGCKAISKCSFSLDSPGLWMLVGSNGSGKSTLFKLIRGMIKPQSGKITCNLKTALVFQNPDHHLLLPTCASDLLLSLPKELSIEERRYRISKVLSQVGLDGMGSRPIHTLSGGQKQKLALAGALASEANLLLLDEPTALLDPISQKSVLTIVQRLCRRKIKPITALWVTHRLEELEYSDGAAIMEKGQIQDWMSINQINQLLNPLAFRRF